MANENEYDGDSSISESTVCKVYDSDDLFTLAVQMVLAFVAIASLYVKRLQEVPRRNFRTWFLDVSKQAIGAGYAHVLNMVGLSFPLPYSCM